MSGKRLGFVGSELVHLAASFGVDAQFFVVFGLLPRFLINRKFADKDKTIAQEIKHSIRAGKRKMKEKFERNGRK